MRTDAVSFWHHQLSGKLSTLPLPLRTQGLPIDVEHNVAYVPLDGNEIIDNACRFAQANASSLRSVLVSAWYVLLARYSGQRDIVVGLAHYDASAHEDRIVPLHIDFAAISSFADLTKKIESLLGEIARWEQNSSAELLSSVCQSLQLDERVLWQAVITFQPESDSAYPSGIDPVSLLRPSTLLQLQVQESATDPQVRLAYDAVHLSPAMAAQMARHLGRFISNAVANAASDVWSISILSEEERHRILVEWNNTKCDYPADLCIQHLFERQVERTPNKCALVFRDRTYTYRELNDYANRLARYLTEEGVKPDTLVGVFMERSPELVIALLAVLKAGAAYVPLDPGYPEMRITYMVENAQIPIVLTQQSLKSRFPVCSGRIVSLDQIHQVIERFGGDNLSAQGAVTSMSRAYVIYTSGSTGKPKGIQITHRNVMNFLFSMADRPGLREEDIFAAVTTISFDIHVLELYLPLSVGATLVLADDLVRTDGEQLGRLLRDKNVTAMQATPATWRMLIAAGWTGGASFKIFCGGEAMPLDLLKQLLQSAGNVWNMYGPTETTVWSTCTKITDADGFGVIGRPIANTRIYVLDDLKQPVPIGVPGEIYISGDGVALGYLNNDALTAERFVEDPFSTLSASRLYRTGDRGRYRENGDLEYIDRNDLQVKVRGFRIELGEIEHALRSVAEIKEAAVLAQHYGEGDFRIVAYVVPITGTTLTVSLLRNRLRTLLPDYMVPSLFVALEAFPLTPNGKLDRNRLPELSQGGLIAEDSANKPANATELRMIGIWKELLKVPTILTDQTFLDQGGTSLLLLQVAIRTEKEFGIRLSPSVLGRQTLSQLALLCTEKPAQVAKTKRGFLGRFFGA